MLTCIQRGILERLRTCDFRSPACASLVFQYNAEYSEIKISRFRLIVSIFKRVEETNVVSLVYTSCLDKLCFKPCSTHAIVWFKMYNESSPARSVYRFFHCMSTFCTQQICLSCLIAIVHFHKVKITWFIFQLKFLESQFDFFLSPASSYFPNAILVFRVFLWSIFDMRKNCLHFSCRKDIATTHCKNNRIIRRIVIKA